MAADFDGAADAIKTARTSVPSGAGGEDLTISLWFKLADITQNNQAPLSIEDEWTNRIDAGNSIIYLLTVGGNDGGFAWVADANWHHLMQTWDVGVGHTAYLDGANKVVGNPGNADTSAASGHNLFIGGRDDDNNGTADTWWFDGLLADIRLYNRILSAAEAAILYGEQGGDTIVNGLVARWRMDEQPHGTAVGGANTVIDISGTGNHGALNAGAPTYASAPLRAARVTMND